jgi:hypothetical protein
VLAPDERRLVPALRRLEHPREPVRRDRLRLSLQLERLDGLDLDRLADELERRLAEQHLARLGACSSRAATLTASPVASRSSVPVTTCRCEADARLHAELGQRFAHLRGRRDARSASSSCSHRHAEDGHHRVADELLDGAAVRSTIAFIRSK